MRLAMKMTASILASAALVASSTAGAATVPAAAQASAAQVQAPSPWMVLSAMSSNSTRAVALGGSNAAAQPADQPPPPEVTGKPVLTGELIAFGVFFALIIVALTISGSGGPTQAVPNSPA